MSFPCCYPCIVFAVVLKTQGDECQGQSAVSLQGIFRLNPPEGSQAQRELGERKIQKMLDIPVQAWTGKCRT